MRSIALPRGTTTYTNGAGSQIPQVTGGVTTRYTQDLAAPLSQVLQTQVGAAARTDYLYGLNRLASLNGSTKTWYAADALGSVRRTVTDAGVPLGIINYDPWGTPETGTVLTFGFTGELQDVSAGLVNLRARWYSTGRGRFITQDTWAGDVQRPGSFNRYSYTESNPVNRVDPTGHTWTYNWSLVRQLKTEIVAAAQFHERPSDGFPWQITAAIMGVTIAREQRGERKPKDWLDDLIFSLGGNSNDSTGIANIRPSLAFEIYKGILPDVSGKFEFKMTADTCNIFSKYLDSDDVLSKAESRSLRTELRNNNKFTLDLLGVNIERGIDRAKAFPVC